MTTLLLVLGFVLLIKGADLLVNGASHIARRLHVSDLAIGLTVVAFGTSLPELFVNVYASFSASSELAIANVLGSNSANILLILGIAAIIYPLSVTRGTVWKEIPFSLLAIVVLGVLVNDSFFRSDAGALLSRSDGVILLAFFLIFLWYSVSIAQTVPGMNMPASQKTYSVVKASAAIIIGLGCLIIGGKWIVDAAVTIARQYGISERVIGLTIVAVGTSLPELATSAVAAYKRNVEIAVGNVVGSNIFNIFFILGVSAGIREVPFSGRSNVDIAVVIGASALLFLSMFTGKRRVIDRWEGFVFVGIYCLYVGMIIFIP